MEGSINRDHGITWDKNYPWGKDDEKGFRLWSMKTR